MGTQQQDCIPKMPACVLYAAASPLCMALPHHLGHLAFGGTFYCFALQQLLLVKQRDSRGVIQVDKPAGAFKANQFQLCCVLAVLFREG